MVVAEEYDVPLLLLYAAVTVLVFFPPTSEYVEFTVYLAYVPLSVRFPLESQRCTEIEPIAGALYG